MGTTTTVSRRMVKMKVHRASKPHAPLPKRPPSPPSGDDAMVGDAAKPFVMKAVVRPAPAPLTWWQKAMKPAGIAAGLLVCAGFGYYVVNAPDRPSYSRTEPTTVAASSPSSRARTSSAYPGAPSAPEPIVLSNRSTPTDQSFQATAYVRKKVYLPNIDGDCVIKGGLDRVVADCLRSQGER